ncbi:hypothetical protein, partial [Xiamenia xianingshaonis]
AKENPCQGGGRGVLYLLAPLRKTEAAGTLRTGYWSREEDQDERHEKSFPLDPKTGRFIIF